MLKIGVSSDCRSNKLPITGYPGGCGIGSRLVTGGISVSFLRTHFAADTSEALGRELGMSHLHYFLHYRRYSIDHFGQFPLGNLVNRTRQVCVSSEINGI